jgi:glycosyltransferase involved in cell wall biosynthesis
MRPLQKSRETLPEILMITTYPPHECGIATYSQDLINVLIEKFCDSFTIRIMPLESDTESFNYPEKICESLNTDQSSSFSQLAKKINASASVKMVMIQHEFGLYAKNESAFMTFLDALLKPVAIVFHTVLPCPDEFLKQKVLRMAAVAESIVVMTQSSARILTEDYAVSKDKIAIIPHGTHLVPHADKQELKAIHNLSGKTILTTFGLLSAGKSIETTLDAMPAIIEKYPEALFLIIGKTHPSVVKEEGEKYREMLEAKVEALQLGQHVQYINHFLSLPELLEYLQLTDIYLFTSKDPNQAVSGTFAYAISSGCPIISTPIPHACEVLGNEAGIIIDFEDSLQLGVAVIQLMADESKRKSISSNGLHRMASTAWENAAIMHAKLFKKICKDVIPLRFNLPEINLRHLKRMTTCFGLIQFSKLSQPDIESGYTLDDNARALIAMCQHFELTKEKADIAFITVYLNFIKYCQQPNGCFLNYINKEGKFTKQNSSTNLADANGRAIWALGYLISLREILPDELSDESEAILNIALTNVHKIHSTRAIAFVIKGLHYRNATADCALITKLADRLVQMYRHEADDEWQWFESYLTYANSILPEAMLCAWLVTHQPIYMEIAKSTFHFLLSKTFNKNEIKLISNQTWLHKGVEPVSVHPGGEQPIDVAYTILALRKFYIVFGDRDYQIKIESAFNWFLGNNHLNQIVYNPCTGGCYDGLEKDHVNLNQGAESTISYLMARLVMGKDRQTQNGLAISTEAGREHPNKLFQSIPI